MTHLEIDPELQAWIDPLTPSELGQLEASIVRDGCRDPLVVWGGYLLDGHNRYAICQRHGVEFATYEQSGLATKEDAKIWMIQNQMGKRNLTDFARTAMALKLKPLLEQRAKARSLANIARGATECPNSATRAMRTDESIAKMAGVGRDTVRKVEKIIEKASAEVIAQVRDGKLSVNAAANTIGEGKKPKAASVEEVAIDVSVELTAEVQALREQVEELGESLKYTLADNEMMGRVFDADDKLKAAMDEAARQKAIAVNAERTLAAKNGEYIERAKAVTYWQNRANKFEKELARLKVES